MHSPASAVVSVLLLALTSCATSNHRFARRDGLPPDVAVLEQTRQELTTASGRKSNGLGDVSWVPLIAMNAEVYNVSHATMPKGTVYTDMDAYGPLFLFVDVETFHYDEQQRLYERSEGLSCLWGLFRTERNDVRVPAGWRVDTETSILFGLLRWPAEYYMSNLPIDRLTPVVPAAPSDEDA